MQILKFIKACDRLGLPVAVRLHPNFSGSIQAKLEAKYWSKLLKQNSDTVVISNNSEIDSYALARNAVISGVYRSTIAVELASKGIPFLCCAESAFSHNLKSSLALEELEMHRCIKGAMLGTLDFHEKFFWIAFATYSKYVGEYLK
jgi:hypothetical protein